MIRKISTLLFVFLSSYSFIEANEKYTISICMTSNLENALTCKKRVYDNMIGEVFIVKDKNRYFTYLNVYENKQQANETIKSASIYVKEQKAYVKQIDEKVVKLKNLNKKDFIDLDNAILEEPIVEKIMPKIDDINVPLRKKEEFKIVSAVPQEEFQLISSYPFPEGKKFIAEDEIIEEKPEIKEEKIELSKKEEQKEDENTYEKELTQISMDEFDKANENKQTHKKVNSSYEKKENKEIKIVKKETKEEEKEDLKNIADYQQLIIEVDSVLNYMTVKAQINDDLKNIKTFRVSTGKDDIKKPFGVGKISQISLNPIWYPTETTIQSFKKKGINLPKVVPPGHKYNYMGAAKINLTHIVDGKNTYRIHGTLNESTIGTNESAGCIRMKNSDVLQLANLIEEFSNNKSLDKVKVILK